MRQFCSELHIIHKIRLTNLINLQFFLGAESYITPTVQSRCYYYCTKLLNADEIYLNIIYVSY